MLEIFFMDSLNSHISFSHVKEVLLMLETGSMIYYAHSNLPLAVMAGCMMSSDNLINPQEQFPKHL